MNAECRMMDAEGRRQNAECCLWGLSAVAQRRASPPAKRRCVGHLCPLPPAHRLLPTAYCPLSTAHCLLPTAHCLLPTAHCLLILAVLASVGCSQRIDTVYGQRSGVAPKSVNGTRVLGEMFEQAGHKVYTWQMLTPQLAEQADCIVWFPNDFEPPSYNNARENVRDWLEDWLLDQPGRTLIYVGRDFDAAAWYWEKVKPGAPPDQAKRIEKAAAALKNDFNTDRQAIPAEEDCGWFTVKGKYQPRKVRTLQGKWAEDIDASQVEIELCGRTLAADAAEVLLGSEGDVLVTREQWDASQLIVVVNGSFLLNLPLVNHEHRKLAGKLIQEVGPPRKTVVFLESDSGGPPIRGEDPPEPPTWAEILIFFHFVAVGIVFCFSRWPIFGLPRHLQRESTSDFGKHVEALAELLERSGDRGYAERRLAHYQQTTKGNEQ